MSTDHEILVFAEFVQGAVADATRSAISAAAEIVRFGGGRVTLLLGTSASEAVASASRLAGVGTVIVPQETVEGVGRLSDFVSVVASDYTHLIAGSSSLARAVLPRVSASLDVMQISDVVKILDHDTFVRPIYGGSILATLQSQDSIKVITARSLSFPSCEDRPGEPAKVQVRSVPEGMARSRVIEVEVGEVGKVELATARVVVAGGAGMLGAEGFSQLGELARLLGGALGATRAAVDRGYASKDLQIGQSGKSVAPDLYLAFGISGAVQHIVGIKDAKTIVAINKDADAPIFKFSDFGMVCDAFEVLPALIASLKNRDAMRKA